MLTFTNKGEAHVIEKRRIKGTFMENLELNDFPFDVQVVQTAFVLVFFYIVWLKFFV